METIGIIYTPYETKEECPIQPGFAPDAEARVEVFEKYAAGLKDIETFSHLYLIYRFDRAGEAELIRPTFLDDEPHGIFATRLPSRPTNIGISIVKLEKREGSTLIVKGIDVLNKTPLIDIKPYLPQYDCIDAATKGWTEGKAWREKPEGRE